MVWCGMVWYSMVWYGNSMVWYSIVCYGIMVWPPVIVTTELVYYQYQFTRCQVPINCGPGVLAGCAWVESTVSRERQHTTQQTDSATTGAPVPRITLRRLPPSRRKNAHQVPFFPRLYLLVWQKSSYYTTKYTRFKGGLRRDGLTPALAPRMPVITEDIV